ncbi:MAG TPA: FAD-dependent oxidoreductase [Mycobacteriales bacterium]|nr:FAD-dependent oxidoreductase [Mycobacteriales bacterium]
MARERVAVVGAGVAGLTAGYLLQRRYDVTLFESEPRLGGHAHTHDVVTPDAGMLAIDSGFIVHNRVTYPSLLRLFDELDIATQPTEMSMSVSCQECGLEYAGARGIGGLFARARSLARPAYLRMLTEVSRFHRAARRHLDAGDDTATLGDFLRDGGYSAYFVTHFVVPLVSAVWSAAPGDSLRYPARYLFAFLSNHGVLSVTGSPQWRTVVGGSRTYVERAAKHLSAVETATSIRGITRHPDGVDVRDDADVVRHFDRVVVATHADTALSLLTDPTDTEQAALGAFEYSHNPTVLHTDATALPTARRARASWNYRLPSCAARTDHVLVSYDLTRLQNLPTATAHLVTLNPDGDIAPEAIISEMVYTHPIFTRESVAAQRLLPSLNRDRTAFAGAYHGWGFHEDGCRSGVEAAASFGVTW